MSVKKIRARVLVKQETDTGRTLETYRMIEEGGHQEERGWKRKKEEKRGGKRRKEEAREKWHECSNETADAARGVPDLDQNKARFASMGQILDFLRYVSLIFCLFVPKCTTNYWSWSCKSSHCPTWRQCEKIVPISDTPALETNCGQNK